ncbi:vitellogenin-3-like [Amphibalanus amphitrite]|uniref:vitellogenin-3-like n=1 Tax=Amphibalanus amphitrite TaxID=1232801 RepID=UPI001C929EEE|nr:vitellogenin-3-like [Amphibalanus amphitrite]
MKATAALLLLAAVVASANNYGFKPGTQYEYRFVAKVLTGIPEISAQYSAMGLRGSLLVQATTPNELQFKLQDTDVGELRNKQVELPWHQTIPLSWQPVTELRQLLELPFIVKIEKGMITELIVGGEEPENIVNMKKAIVQRWQMNMNKEVIAEFPSGKFFEDTKQPLYFEAEEQSIGGLCLTGYTVTPILEPQTQLEIIKTFDVSVYGDWLWTEQSVPKELKKPRFVITKNVFHDKCKRRPIFQHMSPAPASCRENVTDCFNTQANTTTTVRYLVRGDRKAFEIEAVDASSIHMVYPFQWVAEQLMANTYQKMLLEDSRPITSPFPEPPQPRSLKLISWSVTTRESTTPESQFMAKPTLTDAPAFNMARPIVPLHEILKKMPAQDLKQQVLEVLVALDFSFDQVPDPNVRDMPGMLNALTSLLNVMSLSDMEEIYGQISTIQNRNIDVMKKLFREAIAMTGTNPSIMMVKKWVESKEVVGAEAATIVMFIPMHIKTPTVEIVQELFNTLQNGIAENDEHLRQNTMLALATVINVACIRPATASNAFPITMFKEFCNPETPQLVQKWIPLFTSRLNQDASVREKMVALKALSILQHPTVLMTLAEVASKTTEDVHVRDAAIYAMMKFREINPVLVEEVVKPIVFNRNEFYEVRIAATTVLMVLNAPLATYQTLAIYTWVESDQQISNFISSFLEEAANMTDLNVPWLFEIREKARVVYRLTRPMFHSDFYSRNTFVRSQIDLMMATAELFTVVNSSPFDISSFTYRGTVRSYNSMIFYPLQMSTEFIGLQNVIDFLMNPDSQSSITRFNKGSEPLQAALSEVADMKKLLKLVKRENEPLLVWLHANIMGSLERVLTFDQGAIQHHLKKLRDDETLTKYEFSNFQKTMNLLDHVIGLPTDIGVPMMIMRSAPALLSIRGDIDLETMKFADGNRLFTLNAKQLQPFINVKMMSLVGALNPFSMRMMSAGVSHNIMMSFPITASTRWESQSKRLEILARLINAPNDINLVRVETKPFTSAWALTQATDTMLQHPDTKPMHARTPTTLESRFGMELFGIDMAVTYKSEDDFSSMYDLFRKMSATSKLGNMFTLLPTIRYNLISLHLNTAEASTQQMIISFAKDTFGRHHTLKTINDPDAEPKERIEWLGDKMQYRGQKHAAAEKEARREVMERSRRVLGDVQTGDAVGYTAVISTMGLKEHRMIMKLLMVEDASRLNKKVDARWIMTPTSEMPTSLELIVNGHVAWPRVHQNPNEMLASNMHAPFELTASIGVNDTKTRLATIEGFLHQSDIYKTWAATNRVIRECTDMRNKGFENAPICEMAKIKASRLNRVRVNLDMNTNIDKLQSSTALLGGQAVKKINDLKNGISSWADALSGFLMNSIRLSHLSSATKPSKLSKNNQRRVEFEFEPYSKSWALLVDTSDKEFLVKGIRPTETLNGKTNGVYNNRNNFGLSIPFMSFLNINEGINAYEDSWQTRNRKMMGNNMHKCVIDERFIKTFDNVVLPVKMNSSCWHLIASDCSENTNLAVLVKEIASRRAVRIITKSRIIELTPSGVEYIMHVNDNDGHRLPVGELVVIESETADKIPEARILKWSGELLEVELPQYQARLRIVGPAVKLMLEPMFLRNRVCGICGDMNGESSQDLIGPKRCLFFGAREFQAAYMVDKTCQRDPLPNYGDDCVKVKREPWMLN